MPQRTRHNETGILLTERGRLVLARDDGGIWLLDAGWRTRRHLGRRVRITGIRDGFDLLAVTSVTPL